MTFSTDLFHPLIAPLTTYMYTTDIQDNGTVSATDDERLPPGGYSLRHGFPSWFGRRRRAAGSTQQREPATPSKGGGPGAINTPDSRGTAASTTPGAPNAPSRATNISTYEVLHYMRSTFDDESVMDSLPLEAAGNPGAWYAWQTRQRQLGKGLAGEDAKPQPAPEGEKNEAAETAEAESTEKSAPVPSTPTVPARDPGQWNWDGVWEDRVKKGVAASLSEPVLYGGVTAGDDLVRFL